VFLNLLLAGGLAAAAAPILVHIAHRRKITPVDWGAMRFLLEMMRRSRKRLFIEQWLLLAIRTAAVGCLALALMRPAIAPRPIEAGGQGVIRHGRVAAVILLDDSASTGAGRGRSSLERMKELALAYIDTLEKGDEVSLVRLSQLGETLADPLLDREAAKDWVRAVEPTGFTSDVPALLETGLVQLSRHFNPSAELVLVTDGGAEGWRLRDRVRWSDLQAKLAPGGDGRGNARPRLIVLKPPRPASLANVAVSELCAERALVPVGRKVGVRARVDHAGGHVAQGMRVQFAVDGRVVTERPLQLEAGGGRDVVFRYAFAEGGSHSVEVRVTGSHDAFALDDRRALSVDVLERVPVLLVEEKRAEGLEGSLGFLQVALDPAGDGSRLFDTDRISVGQLSSRRLHDYRTVVMGELSALDAAAVAALERYVVAGGGLLVGLGRRTDVEHVNRFWARNGDGFLPCPLGELLSPEKAETPGSCSVSHPAFAAFVGPSGEAWKSGEVRRYYAVKREAVDQSELDVLLALESGDPLLLERSRGRGRVVMVTSTLSAAWNDLPARAAYVPLMRGLVAHLASQVRPPRNLRLGGRISHISSSGRPELKGPDGGIIPLEVGSWEGRKAYLSPRLEQSGVYSVRAPGTRSAVHYALALEPAESRLELLEEAAQEKALGRMRPVVLGSAAEVTEVLDPAHRRPAELWRYLLLGAILLLFLESLVTRGQAVRRSASGGAG
jgi:hypothetical protein